jgi:uncharacterized repeat protein (TIGR03803 family)
MVPTPTEDGFEPRAGVSIDPFTGNLYGTTYFGGAEDAGTIFRLTRNSSGKWSRQIFFSFGDAPDFASNPQTELIAAGGQLVVGTTSRGGKYFGGIAFTAH